MLIEKKVVTHTTPVVIPQIDIIDLIKVLTAKQEKVIEELESIKSYMKGYCKECGVIMKYKEW